MKTIKLFLFATLLSVSWLFCSIDMQPKINKQELTQKIKNLIFEEFVYEIHVIVINPSSYSQGNKELEEDIINLNDSFSIDWETAQTKLDEFCKKWDLENIKISDAWNDLR